MVIPIIASISREVFSQAPVGEREAAYALGCEPLGDGPHRRPALRPRRHDRRDHARLRPGDGRDDRRRADHLADLPIGLPRAWRTAATRSPALIALRYQESTPEHAVRADGRRPRAVRRSPWSSTRSPRSSSTGRAPARRRTDRDRPTLDGRPRTARRRSTAADAPTAAAAASARVASDAEPASCRCSARRWRGRADLGALRAGAAARPARSASGCAPTSCSSALYAVVVRARSGRARSSSTSSSPCVIATAALLVARSSCSTRSATSSYRGCAGDLRTRNFFTQTMALAGPLDPLTVRRHGARAGRLARAAGARHAARRAARRARRAVPGRGRRTAGASGAHDRRGDDGAARDHRRPVRLRLRRSCPSASTQSGLAASLALTVMMIPIVTRSRRGHPPAGARQAARGVVRARRQPVADGVNVVLPTARSGLATAVILAMARAVGETSPVLLTAGLHQGAQRQPVLRAAGQPAALHLQLRPVPAADDGRAGVRRRPGPDGHGARPVRRWPASSAASAPGELSRRQQRQRRARDGEPHEPHATPTGRSSADAFAVRIRLARRRARRCARRRMLRAVRAGARGRQLRRRSTATARRGRSPRSTSGAKDVAPQGIVDQLHRRRLGGRPAATTSRTRPTSRPPTSRS